MSLPAFPLGGGSGVVGWVSDGWGSGGREGGRERGRQGGRQGGREAGREVGRQAGREGGKEGGRDPCLTDWIRVEGAVICRWGIKNSTEVMVVMAGAW